MAHSKNTYTFKTGATRELTSLQIYSKLKDFGAFKWARIGEHTVIYSRHGNTGVGLNTYREHILDYPQANAVPGEKYYDEYRARLLAQCDEAEAELEGHALKAEVMPAIERIRQHFAK